MPQKGQITVRTSGFLVTTPLDGGAVIYEETVQCVHCQAHKVYKPETFKKVFAWCTLCSGPICNTPECSLKCVPAEQWLENVEQGKPEDHRRIIVPGG